MYEDWKAWEFQTSGVDVIGRLARTKLQNVVEVIGSQY